MFHIQSLEHFIKSLTLHLSQYKDMHIRQTGNSKLPGSVSAAENGWVFFPSRLAPQETCDLS